MKTVRDVMTTDVVWVSPSARVKTAVILMKGHNIGALPVVQANDTVAGIVTYQSLLGEPQDSAVMDVMETEFFAVEPDMSIYDAAEMMHQRQAGHLLVTENDRLVGIVSHHDLITELGKNFDPLTNLPWQDAFRDWAVNALKRGQEISIILFDLNKFGLFNKKYGHVVGDRVLQQVAEVLKAGIDPEIELLCRYAGDEFGIVSLRLADDAIALADTLKERISQIQVPDLPEGISATYGIAGGRRTKEREDVHYAATMDNLITRASKDCTLHKPHRAEEQPAQPAAAAQPQVFAPAEVAPRGVARAPRLKIQSITVTTTESEATVGVTLTRSGREFVRQASGYSVGGANTLRLVAEATAGAVCKSLAAGHGIVVDEVLSQATGPDEEVMTVMATFISPRWSTRTVGSAVVRRGDRFRAVAAAVLAAVNRQLEEAVQAPAEEPEPAPSQESIEMPE